MAGGLPPQIPDDVGDDRITAFYQTGSRNGLRALSDFTLSPAWSVWRALAVKTLSGMSYGEAMTRRVLQPLKLAHTLDYGSGERTKKDYAWGYREGKSAYTFLSGTKLTPEAYGVKSIS